MHVALRLFVIAMVERGKRRWGEVTQVAISLTFTTFCLASGGGGGFDGDGVDSQRKGEGCCACLQPQTKRRLMVYDQAADQASPVV